MPPQNQELTQNLLQLHDTGVCADVLDGLGLPLIAALLEHLVLGAIGLPSRHSEAVSICLGSMALFWSWYPASVEREWMSRGAVSYTHLRAHETDSYLVCRLLLEKKKYAVFCLKKKNSFFFFFFLMIRRQPRSTHCISSAASDVYKRQ